MAKKPNDWNYMESGERERILGTGAARNAAKEAKSRNDRQKARLDEIMGVARGARKRKK